MKKPLVIVFSISLFVIVALFVASVLISFTIIKPTTETINNDLEKFLTKIVYIPKSIPRPIYDFNETIYFWEMETPQNEVTGINFKYTTAFSKNENQIEVTLEMPQGGDASIFTKVLPAVIADKQSLIAAQDTEKANLGANETAGYKNIMLQVKSETKQTTKITWEFEKQSLPENLQVQYQKLGKYPQGLLKTMYGIPHLIISLLRG